MQQEEYRLLKRRLGLLIDKVGAMTSTITALELEVEKLKRRLGS
jgi:hypothetical protein